MDTQHNVLPETPYNAAQHEDAQAPKPAEKEKKKPRVGKTKQDQVTALLALKQKHLDIIESSKAEIANIDKK